MNKHTENQSPTPDCGSLSVTPCSALSAQFDGYIDRHPMHRLIYELMVEIEKLPGSEQQTKVVTLAGELQHHVTDMRIIAKTNASCLRRYGEECFPADANGQIHFARAIMESVADELDEHLNPSLQNASGEPHRQPEKPQS